MAPPGAKGGKLDREGELCICCICCGVTFFLAFLIATIVMKEAGIPGMAEMAIDFDSEEFKNQYPDYYNAKK